MLNCEDALAMNVFMMQPDEVTIVARRTKELLK